MKESLLQNLSEIVMHQEGTQDGVQALELIMRTSCPTGCCDNP
jgi:hypothetical protein